MPGCVGGEAGGAAARGVHPRYVPERGQVLRGVLGALFGCFRPAKTRPLPRLIGGIWHWQWQGGGRVTAHRSSSTLGF
ncbi:hypothetical protein C2845_PM12G26380 [Panicum miliaceum]|uniref:Uncharacterized protein n=3 Tax=Panicum sect. Panicum TaxID=2100772 RepID=A0A3L6QMB2_PANMI|nr:hypothetical protein C2845_PM12G26380 [Panicum miliaceum]